MRIVRAKRAIFVLAALLSLFGSTLAACGCSHHEAAAAPLEDSCHGTSHAQSKPVESVDQAASGNKVETGCRCFVGKSGPSLFSKSRLQTDSSNETPVEHHTFEVDRVLIASSAETTNYYSLIAHYDSRHGPRAPARAPPRL
jgi:hypothetical protein